MQTIHNNGKFIYKFFPNSSKLPPNPPQVTQTKPWVLEDVEWKLNISIKLPRWVWMMLCSLSLTIIILFI